MGITIKRYIEKGIGQFSIFTIMKLILLSSLSAAMGNHRHFQQNVYGQELTTCSTDPMTGWTRDGTCKAYSNDVGTHVTCAELTWDFLEYSKSKGNDLMTPTAWGFPGLREGDRWCLCCNRWTEVYQAYLRGEVPESAVPKIVMTATHMKTLDKVPGGMETLKKFML